MSQTTINNGDTGAAVRAAINGNFTELYARGGAPGLPVWTYTAGAMAAGKITVNDPDVASTSVIGISTTAKTGTADWSQVFAQFRSSLGSPSILVFTNASGASNVFATTNATDNTTDFLVDVTLISAGETTWSGDYQFTIVPTGGFKLQVDSGWTANDDAGTKTLVIGSTSALSGLLTAFDVDHPGVGNLILNVAEKVKALEAALAGKLLPIA